jgi:predicted O-methyltransferase YrrM
MTFDLSKLDRELGYPSNLAETVATAERLSHDEYLHGSTEPLREALRSGYRYYDLPCALQCVARHASPKMFLEVGVRKARSMAQVAVASPECHLIGVDLWVNPYASVQNPGPDFVRAELQRLGHRGPLELFSGDSHVVLPQLFADRPELQFDLINVDGDHSNEGAWDDLTAVVPHLRMGGFLVFDDIIHPLHTLMEVWSDFQSKYAGEFRFLTNSQDRNGTGIAFRIA